LVLGIAAGSPVVAEESSLWVTSYFAKADAEAAASASEADSRETAKRARLRSAARTKQLADSKNTDAFVPSTASLAGSAIVWHASSGCVPARLRSVLADVVGSFGPVTVTSTCRNAANNRAAGGAGQSYHLSGQAVDFRVKGNTGAIYAYLASNGAVGGLHHYGGGLFHIDTGPRRDW
jgi:hypothetical protein